MQETSSHFPAPGFGLGLRIPHYPHIFEHWPEVGWFEIISENFMDTDGKAKRNLARIAERYPIVMHGVALSIGTVDPLNSDYLQKLKTLIQSVRPAWVSDHLCWTGVAHKNSHDLLPLPYTEEALKHIVSRIAQVQDYLGRQIALENPSTYLEFKSSQIPEAEFLAAMVQESGCNLLLDVNNVYVTCYNHRLDAKAYIDALPLEKVIQIHLSGHSNKGTHIIDTHDDHVVEEVWALYRYAIHKAGRIVNTMIEWDDKIPSFDVLHGELAKAKSAAADARHYAPLPDLLEPRPCHAATVATALQESQARMQDAILPGAQAKGEPDAWIRSKERFAPAEQLGVYARAYRYRLYDVTAEDYPVLKHYLGGQAFDTLIEDFVASVRSRHFNIGRYAAQLPDFVARHLPQDRFAQELAQVECAVAQLTDRQETAPLDPAYFEGMTPEALMKAILFPRAALELFALTYPVNRYYIGIMEEGSALAPRPEASFLAVFRHEDVVWRMGLEEQEYHLLKKLFAGQPVGEALAGLQAEFGLAEEELGPRLSDWFARSMRNGLFATRDTAPHSTERNAA